MSLLLFGGHQTCPLRGTIPLGLESQGPHEGVTKIVTRIEDLYTGPLTAFIFPALWTFRSFTLPRVNITSSSTASSLRNSPHLRSSPERSFVVDRQIQAHRDHILKSP